MIKIRESSRIRDVYARRGNKKLVTTNDGCLYTREDARHPKNVHRRGRPIPASGEQTMPQTRKERKCRNKNFATTSSTSQYIKKKYTHGVTRVSLWIKTSKILSLLFVFHAAAVHAAVKLGKSGFHTRARFPFIIGYAERAEDRFCPRFFD